MSADPSLTTTEDVDQTLYHFSSTPSRSGSRFAGPLQTWHIVALTAALLISFVLFLSCFICLCGSKRPHPTKQCDSEAHFQKTLDNGLSNLTIQTTMGGGSSTSNLVSEKVAAMGGIGSVGIHAISQDHHMNQSGLLNHANSVNNVNISHTAVGLNNGHNGAQQETLSPVQSWPADVLLSHYERVRLARERNEEVPVMRAEDLGGVAQAAGSGSCSSGSSNQSRESGVSYGDENALAHSYHGQARDWRYENQAMANTAAHTHTAVPYTTGVTYDGQGYEQYYDPALMQEHMSAWTRASFVGPASVMDPNTGYMMPPPRMDTPSDNFTHSHVPPPFSNNPVGPRRTNAVSQV